MTTTTVTTQDQLDAAISAGDKDIIIASPNGVWLCVSGSATVMAYNTTTVRASESATVMARDSATVRAYDTATVRAYGAAMVTASSHVAVYLYSVHAKISGGVIIDITALDLTDD